MRSRVLDFESNLALRPTDAAAVLGVSSSTYLKFRCEARPLPRWVTMHMEVLELLPKAKRKELIAERASA
ncbi:MAG: hypothetical protein V4787_11695 [Pseudomonadota bacterium]